MKINDIVTWIMGGFFSGLAYILGGIDKMLIAFVIFMVSDYITGILASGYEKKWSSKVGFKGLMKKLGMLVFIIIANQIDVLTGQGDVVRSACLFFLIGTEGISNLENLSRLGLPIPSFIKKRLQGFVDESEKNQNGDDQK